VDNHRVDVVSEGRLAPAFALFEHPSKAGYSDPPPRGVVAYCTVGCRAWKEEGLRPPGVWAEAKTLVFFWSATGLPGGAAVLPFEMPLPEAAAFAEGWLRQAEYGPQPDHDGSNGKGWRVFNEAWGHVGGYWQALLAVQPAWAWYGK